MSKTNNMDKQQGSPKAPIMHRKIEALVPPLRFPEFQDAGEWNSLPFGEVYSFKVTNSFSREKLTYEKGIVKNIHYGDIHTKFSTLFDIKKEVVPFIDSSQPINRIDPDNYCIEGDIVFADASEDLGDIGKSIEIISLNGQQLLSGLHTLLARQKESKIITGFGGYLFQSINIRTQIKREAQGTKILGLSARGLSNINIYFPSHEGEQKKIADCLSSLDNLISTEGKKLEALKAHKKGLMQQLFPREGETVPRLRFPEFRDAGVWEVKQLDDIAEKATSAIAMQELEINSGDYPVYGASGLLTKIAQYASDSEYIGIIKDGAGVGRVMLCPPKSSVIGTLDSITARGDNFTKFIFYWLAHSSLKPYIVGGAIPHIYFKDYSKMTFGCPHPIEQQKIADCLSSLDNLISTEGKKLEALKAHKKGLMQQLFPSTNEVNL